MAFVFVDPSPVSFLTSEQIEYVKKQLRELPFLLEALAPIIAKESVVARDVNANEVKSGSSNAKTNDAANIDALQSKVDLERTLVFWDMQVARHKRVVTYRPDGTVLGERPAGRGPSGKAEVVAQHIIENIDYLAHFEFRGKSGIDFHNEVVKAVAKVRSMLGVHGREDDGDGKAIVITRNAAQVARDSGLDAPARGKEIVNVMKKHGYEDINVELVRQWASRGHIKAVGYEGKFPKYMVADVMEVYSRTGRNIVKKDDYVDAE